MTVDTHTILEKYNAIIAEEVNVKEVHILPDSLHVTTSYIPLGKELSTAFGKDTGRIIAAAKQGQVTPLENGDIHIQEGSDSWVLAPHQYEVRYSGLTGDHQIIEEGVIVELDLTITEELKTEGIARELSRFLNQMRKEADYQVNDRVHCYWYSNDISLQQSITIYHDFLCQEALLQEIIDEKHEGDITRTFTSEEGEVIFTLKK